MAKTKTKTKKKAKPRVPSRAKTKPRSKAKPKKKKKRVSSSLTLTQEIIDKAAAVVQLGNFRYVARGTLGIPEGTWKSWLAHGRRDLLEGDGDSLQAKLVMALDKSENIIHAKIIENVMALDVTNPAAMKLQLDYLYRRHGKLYSKNPNAHDDDSGETVKIVDPLAALAEKLDPFCD